MNMLIPDEGRLRALDAIFRAFFLDESFGLGLFTAPIAVGQLSTLTDFTFPTFQGGSPITFPRGDWLPPVIANGRGVITLSFDPSWTMLGGVPETVYGWVLWGIDSAQLYAGANFDIPRDFVIGASLTLSPFKIDSQAIGD